MARWTDTAADESATEIGIAQVFYRVSIVITTLGFPSRELGFETICVRFDVLCNVVHAVLAYVSVMCGRVPGGYM